MIYKFEEEHFFLSNFYPCKVTFEGWTYKTAEHAFQAAKSVDPKVRFQIAELDSPAQAKQKGKKVTLRSDWEQIKVEVMLKILRSKFNQNSDLKEKLLSTGTEELVEGNTWNDTFWGVCRGVGQNILGKLLMQVRNELIG